MKLTKCIVPILGVIATVGLANPAFAADAPPSMPPAEKPNPPGKAEPFRGTISAVDTTAMALTVDGKLYYITATTKLMKGGKTIKLTDIAVGDYVHGVARLTSDGKHEASSVTVGPTLAVR